MARWERSWPVGLGLLLAAPAAAAAAGLYDRPVLVVDPGAHTTMIKALDADRDGRFLVTASHDKTVRVWAAENGRLLRTLRLPAGPGEVGKAYAAAISPDGALVAAGGWGLEPENDVYLFEWASGRLLRRVGGLTQVVLHLAFSPDGTRLAATLGGGGVRLIDPAAGRVVAADEGYGGESYGAAFDAAGRLATTGYDGKVRLYGPGLRLLRAAEAPDGRQPYGIAFSPDGKRLAVGYDDTTAVDVLDAGTLERLFAADTKGVDNGALFAVAWSADGGSLYAGGRWRAGSSYGLRRWPKGGRGAPVDLPLSQDAVMTLRGLPGGRLAFAAQDPRLGLLGADGQPAWEAGPATADFRDQYDAFAVSADGTRVGFGYEQWGGSPAVFAMAERRLTLDGPADGLEIARTVAPGLAVEGWKGGTGPSLNGEALALEPYETAFSLAVAPDEHRFVLGATWSLRLFDQAGKELWRRDVPGPVWTVNVSGDGRLVVAAYGDGTIRWHRLEDGQELLALLPLADRTDWAAWTPEGFYAATPGAFGILRWHVNHGRDEAPESFPVADIPGFYRPALLPLVLQELETPRALGLTVMAEQRRLVQLRAHSSVPPGAQLQLLAIGVSRYNDEYARHLRLAFAQRDAHDVASALGETQGSLYAKVNVQYLADDKATRSGILRALATMRAGMSQGGQDLAVVHFSGHGAVVDGELFLLPYDVDARDAVGIKDRGLSVGALRAELLQLAERGRVLVLLDACYSGGMSFDGRGGQIDAKALSTMLAASNVTVLTSSSKDETSHENPAWQNGAFTKALLEALGGAADDNKDGLISATELARYVDRRVRNLTDEGQTPAMEVRFDGTLFEGG